jgi:hypothetical protein
LIQVNMGFAGVKYGFGNPYGLVRVKYGFSTGSVWVWVGTFFSAQESFFCSIFFCNRPSVRINYSCSHHLSVHRLLWIAGFEPNPRFSQETRGFAEILAKAEVCLQTLWFQRSSS